MSLPPTYYDVLFQKHPEVVVNAGMDAHDLLGAGRTIPVAVVDDSFPNRLEQTETKYLEGLYAEIAKQGRCSIEAAKHSVKYDPISQKYVRAALESMQMEYFSLINFEMFGKRIFYLRDGLVQHLACTEMNVTAPLLQLPFPSCMFVFTSREAVDALYRISSSENNPDRESSNIDYGTPVSVFLAMCEPDEVSDQRRLVIVAAHANDRNNYMMVKRSLNLPEDWTLEQALQTDWLKLNEDKGDGYRRRQDETQPLEPISDEVFYGDGLLFFRIVLNAALYISCADAECENVPSPQEGLEDRLAEIKSSLERRNVFRAATKASRLPYINVGASVPTVVQDKNRPELGASRRKLFIRFTVRGHWRNQACGPGWQNRELRFIKPYNKGPEMAELVNKPYIVR